MSSTYDAFKTDGRQLKTSTYPDQESKYFCLCHRCQCVRKNGSRVFSGGSTALKWIEGFCAPFTANRGNYKLWAEWWYNVCYKHIFIMLNLHNVQLSNRIEFWPYLQTAYFQMHMYRIWQKLKLRSNAKQKHEKRNILQLFEHQQCEVDGKEMPK